MHSEIAVLSGDLKLRIFSPSRAGKQNCHLLISLPTALMFDKNDSKSISLLSNGLVVQRIVQKH